MPRVHQFGAFAVYVYADDHAPPHFHVVGPDAEAQVDIATLQIIRGTISKSAWAEVVAWAAENNKFLTEKWSELNERD